jgi:hypothetical protein
MIDPGYALTAMAAMAAITFGLRALPAFGKEQLLAANLVAGNRAWPRATPPSPQTSARPATFTCGCLAGLTTITPYWLNRRCRLPPARPDRPGS